jgi:hypothetical protein
LKNNKFQKNVINILETQEENKNCYKKYFEKEKKRGTSVIGNFMKGKI